MTSKPAPEVEHSAGHPEGDSQPGPHTHPRIASIVDYRAALVASLQRSLVGPTPCNETWMTDRPPRLYGQQGTSADVERPIGPFVNPSGNEVLPCSPRSMYVTGVLWGGHADAEASDDVAGADTDDLDTDDLDTTEPPKRGQAARIVSPDEAEGELDDLDDDEVSYDVDTFGKRRSVAVSFRIPATAAKASVQLSYGTYSSFKVPVGDRDEEFWERTPHHRSATISVSESSELEIGDSPWRLRLGATVRPEESGSRLITVWLRNDTGPADVFDHVEGATFQTQLSLDVEALLPYAPPRKLTDSLDFIYRDVVELAVGHGTDVEVGSSEQEGWARISTVAMPVVEVPAMTPDVSDADGVSYRVGMRDLALGLPAADAAIERLIDGYAAWIDERTAEARTLSSDEYELGAEHLNRCGKFLQQIRDGWTLVGNNADVRECLGDASAAMDSQRRSMQTRTRDVDIVDGSVQVDGAHPHHGEVAEQGFWRPFQIAFVLASLPKIVDPLHDDRGTVDVIWMPTGGGKTEAYLGLAAFTILWERLQQAQGKSPPRAQCTKVLMRYTLRLLTVQQFLRSAALVCALEIERQKKVDRYGKGEVRIGTWVGSSTTDNRRATAVKRLNYAVSRGDDHGFLLSKCPWCAAAMGHVVDGTVVGFHRVSLPNSNDKRVLAACPDPTCEFRYRQERLGKSTVDRGIPVMTVDEDVYDYPPDFVIGTVDKVAMMWDQTKAQQLFGLYDGVRKAAPPALFIQDELHLITGPLGSLDGVYEVMLATLCAAEGGRAPTYVASTATTRNFDQQISALYGLRAALVPPPGLRVADSFFSQLDPKSPGRLYVGVCSTGGVPNSETQARVLAVLAHFGAALDALTPEHVDPDPYWTNVCFFSSRAALGTLTFTVETALKGNLDRLRRTSGTSSGVHKEDGSQHPLRWISRPREITATASENVTVVLDDLGLARSDDGAIDLCFATSMIEVGLDVSRLGLMTVIGQPKGSSQYIQVTGRVGRSMKAPALVVDVLGTRTPRDRSHYEHFTAWHRRLYASVEGASATPFTERALDRTLPSVAAVLCQVLGGSGTVTEQIDAAWPLVTEVLMARAERFGPRAVAATAAGFDRLRRSAGFADVRRMSWTHRTKPELKFLFAFGEDIPFGRPPSYWQVLTSMRSVDPDAPARAHNPGIAPRPAIDPQTLVYHDEEGLI